jgi:hypothetical protein
MSSFGRTAGGMGVAILAGSLIAAAPAQAARRRLIVVPCAADSLAAAIDAANATPSVLRLAPSCAYRLATPLPQITGAVTLLGGPSTSIRRDPAVPELRLLDVAPGGRLRVQGITLQGGATTTGPGGAIRNAGALVLE